MHAKGFDSLEWEYCLFGSRKKTLYLLRGKCWQKWRWLDWLCSISFERRTVRSRLSLELMTPIWSGALFTSSTEVDLISVWFISIVIWLSIQFKASYTMWSLPSAYLSNLNRFFYKLYTSFISPLSLSIHSPSAPLIRIILLRLLLDIVVWWKKNILFISPCSNQFTRDLCFQ